MKQTVHSALAVGASLVVAGAASAQFTATHNPRAVDGATPNSVEAVGTVDTALVAFSAGGGAFLGGPLSHSVGTTQAMGAAVNPNITTNIIDNGNGTRTLEATWFSSSGGPLFAAGTTIAGSPITSIQFELGRQNAGTDFFEFPGIGAIKHAVDAASGAFLADFSLLDASGASIFNGNFFVFGEIGGFSGIVSIGAGGADLGTFNIGGGVARITFNVTDPVVPTPGAVALFGLAGLAGARRRR